VLTFVWGAPVVPVADPVAVAAVKVPGVVVGEDRPEAVVDHVLDRFVLNTGGRRQVSISQETKDCKQVCILL